MLDIKKILENSESITKQLKIKKVELDVIFLEEKSQLKKNVQLEVEDLQNKRNLLSKEVGKLKAQKQEDQASKLITKVDEINEHLIDKKKLLDQVQEQINNYLATIPNIPDSQVPEGKNENDNLHIKTVGEIRKFEFEAKENNELIELLSTENFESAAKISGSRFMLLQNDLALLHRALINLMVDTQIENGYNFYYLPYMANETSVYASGQLPKFKEDLFKVENTPYYLIPTAEVALANIYRDTILKEENLPLKVMAHTPCFRSEAGSYGKDTKGIFRQHQFEKVEIFQFTHPEQSYQALEEMLSHAESVLNKLDLHYQVVSLCGGDLGFCAARTYDIEVYLPGQKQYREISSCSNCTDFQARRLKIRFKDRDKRNQLVHTLNASGVAVGRCLIAVLENYQQADGSIIVPDVLVSYMHNKKIIETIKLAK